MLQIFQEVFCHMIQYLQNEASLLRYTDSLFVRFETFQNRNRLAADGDDVIVSPEADPWAMFRILWIFILIYIGDVNDDEGLIILYINTGFSSTSRGSRRKVGSAPIIRVTIQVLPHRAR